MAKSEPRKWVKKSGQVWWFRTGKLKRIRRRGSPDDMLTTHDIAREYGGTPEQWHALIRSGKLPHATPSSRIVSVERAQVESYRRRALARALAADAPIGGEPATARGPFEERDGDLYFAGTSIPVPDLERARRAGSSEAELRAAFPELPAGAFDAVDAMLRGRPDLAAAWADRLAPTPPDAGDEDDDGQGFEAELEELLDTHAELFRRLAQ